MTGCYSHRRELLGNPIRVPCFSSTQGQGALETVSTFISEIGGEVFDLTQRNNTPVYEEVSRWFCVYLFEGVGLGCGPRLGWTEENI